jgi:hypothetical protein
MEKDPILSPPEERLTRDECLVGDWVDALHVPEWREALTEQTFRPERSIVISPQLGRYGGVAPAGHPQEWRFVRDHLDAKPVWRRTA